MSYSPYTKASAAPRNALLPAGMPNPQADALAVLPGAALHVITKRAGDCRPYMIDMQPLLRSGEIVTRVDEVQAPGLQQQRCRAWYGTWLELTLGGGEPGAEIRVVCQCSTTRGALQAEFLVRVIKP